MRGRGIGFDAEVEVVSCAVTAERWINRDDETNRGDAFARPEDISGVIPGAVDVADYTIRIIH